MTDLPPPDDFQWAAIKKAVNFIRDSSGVFRIFGPAGTGKTVMIRHILNEAANLGPIYVCTLSGKAVDVLHSKGIPQAQTIHSLIYRPISPSPGVIEDLLKRLERTKDARTQAELRGQLQRLTELRWGLSGNSEKLMEGGTLILDEAFMIGESILADIQAFPLKILAVGDPFQLPPVKDKPCLAQSNPEVMLTEIHRQAKDSGILRLATEIREGHPLTCRKESDCLVTDMMEVVTPTIMSKFSQVITGKHLTRREINRQIRKELGYEGVRPQPGEKLICTSNTPVSLSDGEERIIYNGQELEVEGSEDSSFLSFRMNLRRKRNPKDKFTSEVYSGHFEEHYDPDELRNYRNHGSIRKLFNADFSYAITCHKAQGSEYDHAVIWDDGMGRNPDDRRRWLYTAVTRARKSAVVYSLIAS